MNLESAQSFCFLSAEHPPHRLAGRQSGSREEGAVVTEEHMANTTPFLWLGSGAGLLPCHQPLPKRKLILQVGQSWGRFQRRTWRAAPMKPQPGKEGLEFSQTSISNYSSTSHSPIISQKGEIYLLFKSFLSLSCYKAHSQSLNFDPQSTIWGWHISPR